MFYKILVIDDDEDILEIVSLYLSNAGFNIHTATTALRAKELLKNDSYDLVLLDIMLPDSNGIKFCEGIRKILSIPVIFISCLNDESNIINALKSGGDDYIEKPFNPNILVAKVKACLRRVKPTGKINNRAFINESMYLNTDTHFLFIDNYKVYLSPIEFKIMEFMISSKNKILTHKEIYENVWIENSVNDTRTVMVHVSNIRKKIANYTDYEIIKTIKKMGYQLIATQYEK